ncbi:kinase-like domain-containing protein [Gongronella butleri]|nr:kinase-like domain-containing protein [Gongronella butleri]
MSVTTVEECKTYLASVMDVSIIDNVTRLSGGNANFVFRVDLKQASDQFDGQTAFVLKHAAPFLAVNRDIKFDPKRMAFEVAAMRRAIEPDVALPTISVPKVFQYDADNAVMIMEYLANTIDLKQHVFGLDAPMAPALAAAVGRDLGHFLARLHLVDKDARPVFEKGVNHDQAVQMYKYAVYEQTESLCERHSLSSDVTAASKWASDHLVHDPATFCMGDYWTGNALIAADDNGNHALRIVDWEISRYAPAGFDLGQMLAEMYSLHKYRQTTDALCTSFLAGYAEHRALDKTQTKIMIIHFGLHLLTWTPFTGWFDKDDKQAADEIIAIGAEYVQHAWNEDWSWFDNTIFKDAIHKWIE